LLNRNTQRLGEVDLQRPLGLASIQAHLAAEESLGVHVPEHKVRIGDSRMLAATAVTGRAWIGACALRAYPQRAAGIHPSDRAAARADGMNVEQRYRDPVSADPLIDA